MPKAKTTAPETNLRSQQRQAALDEYEKGFRLLQQKDYEKAIPRFEAVLSEFPGEMALCDRARVYLRIANGDARAKDPVRSTRDPAQSFEVGAFLLNDGEFKEAARHFERALEHEADDPWTHQCLGSARLQMGDVEGALSALEKAVQLDATTRVRLRNSADFTELHGNEAFDALLQPRD